MSYSTLDCDLESRFMPLSSLTLSREAKERREICAALKSSIKRYLGSSYSSNEFELYLYGSSISKAVTKDADLDLTLVNDKRSYASAIDLNKILRGVIDGDISGISSRVQLVEHISRAKVPILKLRVGGFACDLSVDNVAAVRNSRYLAAIFDGCDYRVYTLVRAVKHWAKSNDINDAHQHTLSSYVLTLMTVFFCQTCQPPLLPINILPEYDVPHESPRSPTELDKSLDDMEAGVLQRVKHFRNYGQSNITPLGQLFADFLKYYANFDFATKAVSVRLGKPIAKRYERGWKHLCVEDPLTQYNAASSVFDLDQFNRIMSVFRRSLAKIEEKGSFDSILPV